MNEQDLLRRIEEQAGEIANLKSKLEESRKWESGEAERLKAALENQMHNMANGAVNCGMHSGCSLARRYLQP